MLSTISGYVVKAEVNGIPYTIYTKKGFRGFNIPCLVWYANASWHVTVQGQQVPIKYVLCDLPGISAKDNLACNADKVMGNNHAYVKACANDWRNP